MLSTNRDTYRRIFVETWRKARAGEALEPLERQIAEVVGQHPEYQELLAGADAVMDMQVQIAPGQTNPFLHMALHLALSDQLSLGRPSGLRELYRDLAAACIDRHALEHRFMDCLAAALWKSQHDQSPLDEAEYLDCVRRSSPA